MSVTPIGSLIVSLRANSAQFTAATENVLLTAAIGEAVGGSNLGVPSQVVRLPSQESIQ
jgi:hypothetical protein